eukprot:g9177.t1
MADNSTSAEASKTAEISKAMGDYTAKVGSWLGDLWTSALSTAAAAGGAEQGTSTTTATEDGENATATNSNVEIVVGGDGKDKSYMIATSAAAPPGVPWSELNEPKSSKQQQAVQVLNLLDDGGMLVGEGYAPSSTASTPGATPTKNAAAGGFTSGGATSSSSTPQPTPAGPAPSAGQVQLESSVEALLEDFLENYQGIGVKPTQPELRALGEKLVEQINTISVIPKTASKAGTGGETTSRPRDKVLPILAKQVRQEAKPVLSALAEMKETGEVARWVLAFGRGSGSSSTQEKRRSQKKSPQNAPDEDGANAEKLHKDDVAQMLPAQKLSDFIAESHDEDMDRPAAVSVDDLLDLEFKPVARTSTTPVSNKTSASPKSLQKTRSQKIEEIKQRKSGSKQSVGAGAGGAPDNILESSTSTILSAGDLASLENLVLADSPVIAPPPEHVGGASLLNDLQLLGNLSAGGGGGNAVPGTNTGSNANAAGAITASDDRFAALDPRALKDEQLVKNKGGSDAFDFVESLMK